MAYLANVAVSVGWVGRVTVELLHKLAEVAERVVGLFVQRLEFLQTVGAHVLRVGDGPVARVVDGAVHGEVVAETEARPSHGAHAFPELLLTDRPRHAARTQNKALRGRGGGGRDVHPRVKIQVTAAASTATTTASTASTLHNGRHQYQVHEQ